LHVRRIKVQHGVNNSATSTISECGETRRQNIIGATTRHIIKETGSAHPAKWLEAFDIAKLTSPRRRSSDHASRRIRCRAQHARFLQARKLLVKRLCDTDEVIEISLLDAFQHGDDSNDSNR
jgi:hypothetical protein